MKKIRVFLWTLLLLWILMPQINASSTAREAVRSIQELNRIRTALSLPTFNSNKELDEAALTHNRYMNYSNVLSSIEEPGKTYYRGKYPWDRAGYAGYEKAFVTEMVGKNFNNFTEGWQTFMGDPYLRYNLLNPNYTDLGMDRFSDYSTYVFGGSSATERYEILYPYAFQSNVPISNDYYAAKNPYDQLEKRDYNGFPLTYTYYSDKTVEKYEIKELSLIRLNNYQKVPFSYVMNSSNNMLIVLPHQKFEYFSSYQLNLRMTLTFSDGEQVFINRVSKFTTETMESAKKKSNVRYLTRVDFVKKLLQTLKFDIKSSLGIIFKDVSPSSADSKYIYTAYVERLVQGTPNGEFQPFANIKEQDAIVIFIRAYEKKKERIVLSNRDKIFQDMEFGYATEALQKAFKIGLMDKNRKSFDFNHYLTVDEFESMIKRYESVIR